jgi:hypothetical protein
MEGQDSDRPDAVDVAIGARIRSRRIYLKMSQTKLVAIAAALEVSVGWLAGEEPGSGGDLDVFAVLAVPGALEMARAFAAIPNARSRATLLALARDMGRKQG